MKSRRFVASVLVVLGLAVAAGSAGTILTAGADIAAATGSPQGNLTIDPAYPGGPLPTIVAPEPLGSIGAIDGSIPAFPIDNTPPNGAFLAASNVTLAGGTYVFTSYSVSPDVVVTYTGAVTIYAKGTAQIAGTVTTSAGGASITLRAQGNLILAGGDASTTERGIITSGSGASIDVAVGGAIQVGTAAADTTESIIRAASGSVTVTGHGAASNFVIGNGIVESDNGIVMVRGAGAVSITGPKSRVRSSVGSIASAMRVQAFGGNLTVDGEARIQANNFSGDLLVEASGGITVTGDSTISGTGGPSVKVSAFGGDVLVGGSTVQANTGGLMIIRASAGVTIKDGSNISSENGALVAVAHGGDLDLQPPGSTGTSNISAYSGNILLAASADVAINEYSNVGSFSGNTDIDAFGDVNIVGSGSITLGSYNGNLEIAAANAIFADVTATPPTLQARGPALTVAAGPGSGFPNAKLRGGTVGLYAGAGGATLDDLEITSESGGLVVASVGPASAHNVLQAAGNLAFETVNGNIDVSNASLSTSDYSFGAVLVWVHLVNGTLDATNAYIRSSFEDGSGTADVSLLVNGAAYAPVASFILPKNINAKVNGQDASKSKLVASGFLDTGPDEVDLSGPATVDVGDLSFEVPGFTPNRSGTKFKYKSTGLVMSISASKVGSSKAKFKLAATGAFSDAPGIEEQITLRFANGAAEGFGIVDLDAGRYTLGRKRGALVEPNISLYFARATLKGGGADALSLKLGLATNGTTPEAAPDVHVGFGTFDTTILGSDFTQSGDRFTYRGAAGGVTGITLDYLKETIVIKAAGVDLGTIPEGGSAVPIRVGLGADERMVTVRMGRKGPAFIY